MSLTAIDVFLTSVFVKTAFQCASLPLKLHIHLSVSFPALLENVWGDFSSVAVKTKWCVHNLSHLWLAELCYQKKSTLFDISTQDAPFNQYYLSFHFYEGLDLYVSLFASISKVRATSSTENESDTNQFHFSDRCLYTLLPKEKAFKYNSL